MEPTSPTLMLRLKQDGPAREIAWSEFRRRYAPVIAGFARGLGVPGREIDDLIQDVLLAFYSVQPQFVYDPRLGRLRGYLKTCVIHRLARRGRQKLKIDKRPIEDIDPADQRIEQIWSASWEREQLHRAIAAVREQLEDGPTFRAFYRLTIEHHEPATVAAELSMSIASVYQAKSRCVVRLRAALKDLEENEG